MRNKESRGIASGFFDDDERRNEGSLFLLHDLVVHRSTHDIEQLRGDSLLTTLVVLQVQLSE